MKTGKCTRCGDFGTMKADRTICMECYRADNRLISKNRRERDRAAYNAASRAYQAKQREKLQDALAQPFSVQSCGREYDPVVCPMRHKAGVLRGCMACEIFKGAK